MAVVLCTGASGSLGKILVDKLIKRGDHVRAMDIHESALAQMAYPPEVFTKIYGDISDYNRVLKAMKGVDIVYHLAALKNIVITEENAPDCVRINVIGTQNVAEAAIERKVKQAIFVSSDKSVEPSTLYGSTKQTGEHLWKAAARIQNTTIFTIVRSGNFFESAGNVFEIWDKCVKEGKPLPITDLEMERYFIEVPDVADILIELPDTEEFNGSVVIPFMKEYNMMDLMLLKYGDDVDFIVTGKRQGEKMKEKLKYDDEKAIYICNQYEVVR